LLWVDHDIVERRSAKPPNVYLDHSWKGSMQWEDLVVVIVVIVERRGAGAARGSVSDDRWTRKQQS